MGRRPELELVLPEAVLPGETLAGQLKLHVRESVIVRSVRVELWGTLDALRSHGGRAYELETLLRSQVRLVEGPVRLSPGTEVHDFAFALPVELPPSVETGSFSVGYQVGAVVDIPWAIDASEWCRVAVGVRPAAPPAPVPEPATSVTRHPYVEMAVSRRTLVAGEDVDVMFSVDNAPVGHFDFLDVLLAGTVVVKRRGRPRYERLDGPGAVTVSPRGEGVPLGHRFRVPADTLPSFATPYLELSWRLAVRGRIAGEAVDVGVPVVVLPPGPAGRRAGLGRQKLVVGRPRQQATFAACAPSHGLIAAGDAIVGQLSGAEVRVTCERRHRAGLWLVAELRYPPLDLALSWPSDRPPRGRDRAQLAAVVERLSPALARVRRVALDDEHAQLELEDPGHDPARLDPFLADVGAVAEAISGLRGEALPPPAALRPALDSWRELARELGGRLETAAMSITRGQHAGLGIEVRTVLSHDGQPLRTALTVRPPLTIDPRHHAKLTAPPAPGTVARAPFAVAPRAQSAVDRLLQAAEALEVSATGVTLWLPGPVLDARRLFAPLASLAELCASFAHRQGPYR